MVFWSYRSDGKELWLDPITFLFKKNYLAARQKKKYWLDPDAHRTKANQYNIKNREKRNQSYLRWKSKNEDKIHLLRINRHYGVSAEKYADMIERQAGVCAICGKPEQSKSSTGAKRRLCIDHRHSDGKVRGLLCTKCNAGIGSLNDDTELMRKAIAYLEETNK